MGNWKAYHIFYHNFEKHDDLIKVIAGKAREFMNAKVVEKWFFLRYWEGGPHLRVRFLNPSESVQDEFINTIRNFIEDNPSQDTLTKEAYYKDHLFDGEVVDIEKISWHKEGEIKNYTYYPEYERYGGKEVIDYSENVFMWSSDLVDKIIIGTKKFEMRMIYSAAISLIILKDIMNKMIDFPIREFFTETIEFWSTFKLVSEEEILSFYETNSHIISKVIDRINEDEQIKIYVDEILNEIHNIHLNITDMNVIASIVGSHLHMTNNRLGITPGFERATLKWISESNFITNSK